MNPLISNLVATRRPSQPFRIEHDEVKSLEFLVSGERARYFSVWADTV